MSQARLRPEDWEVMAGRRNEARFAGTQLAARRQKASQPPEAPTDFVKKLVGSFPCRLTEPQPLGVRAMPPWAAWIVRGRDLMRNTLITMVSEEGEEMLHWVFLWASAQPFVLWLQQARRFVAPATLNQEAPWQQALAWMGRTLAHRWERELSMESYTCQCPPRQWT